MRFSGGQKRRTTRLRGRALRKSVLVVGAVGVTALVASCAAAPDGGGGTVAEGVPTTAPAPTDPGAPPTTAPPTTAPSAVGAGGSFRMAATKASTAGCTMFPPDHFLNTKGIERLPVHARSAAWIGALGGAAADMKFPSARIWDSARAGMPINVVDSRVTGFSEVMLNPWGSARSYQGPYPMPDRPLIQGHPSAQWDRHVLIIDVADCMAYELIQYDPLVRSLTGRHAALSGTRYPLGTSDMPTMTTNAPKTPMLGQYVLVDEVERRSVDHVIGFCTNDISTSHQWPARASDGVRSEADAIPMGAWLRLRADADLSGFGPGARAVAAALRTHGAVLTDTCAHDFFLMAENSPDWNEADVTALRSLTAADFEVVDTTALRAEGTSFRIR